ncbi:hypothetical protein SLA2020_036040 [Shorea laevis]
MAPHTDILTSNTTAVQNLGRLYRHRKILYPLFNEDFDMELINSSFQRDCKEMLRVQKPDIICFLETKADSSSRAMQFMLHFGYDKQFQVPSSGFAGGL